MVISYFDFNNNFLVPRNKVPKSTGHVKQVVKKQITPKHKEKRVWDTEYGEVNDKLIDKFDE